MRLTNENPYTRMFTDLSNENVSVVEGKNASLGEMVRTVQLKNRRDFNMLHNELKRLDGVEDILFIDNKIFNAVQIINQIIESFEPKGNNLNFSCQDSFIKNYFSQKNVQGIFNRVEWFFLLRRGVKCELLIAGNNDKQKGKLEIRVTIKFSPSRKQVNSMLEDAIRDSLSIENSKTLENLEIKVSLDFCPDESEVEDTYANARPQTLTSDRLW